MITESAYLLTVNGIKIVGEIGERASDRVTLGPTAYSSVKKGLLIDLKLTDFFLSVSNKWIHEHGQEFRRKCGLSSDE